MLRFFAGAGSALLLVVAGFFIWQIQAESEPVVPQAPEPEIVSPLIAAEPVEAPPAAPERTREERRFDRADKNKDGRITLDELYAPRRKAFAKLDTNGDGRLSFEEWAVTTRRRFEKADSNRDGQLTREEYATTRPKARPKAACKC